MQLHTAYLNGCYVSPCANAEIGHSTNPATGETLAQIQLSDVDEVNAAVRCAQAGQKHWASKTAVERSRILHRAVALLRERNDELAHLETLDTGKPISETASVDIHTGADVIEYYAELAVAIEGRQIPLRESSFVYTRQEPLGVIAAIGAWNYPMQIAMCGKQHRHWRRATLWCSSRAN